MKKVFKFVGFACAALFVLILVVGIFGNSGQKGKASPPSEIAASAVTTEAAVQKKNPAVETKTEQKESPPVETEAADKDLDMTPDQYAKNFNAIMAKLKEPFRIKPRLEKGGTYPSFCGRGIS
ncbi:hypothetical protein [Burkholderia ubonensis]|uniref:hypothetical protein n=1 Tax=Burkholderia ubonensis TaxID=101571 RepID=UPI00075D03BF|nr:hypothetical protein [Burkholderia ubonensis]KVD08028.1 hypothetical protein WI79_08070 [Burkholderia ubonensis]